MWILSILREELPERLRQAMLGEIRDAIQIRSAADVLSGLKELTLVWQVAPREEKFLPAVIVTQDSKKQELLAWMSTYMSTLRPITGLVRLIERSMVQELASRRRPSNVRGFLPAAVGMIIAETASRQHADDSSLFSLSDCRATFSYAFARAMFTGATTHELSNIPDTWWAVQKYDRMAIRKRLAVELMLPWLVLSGLSGAPIERLHHSKSVEEVTTYVRQIKKRGRLSQTVRKAIAANAPWIGIGLEATGEGTRESRVLALERALMNVPGDPESQSSGIAALAVGYIANEMAPGTLEYLSLLKSLVSDRPELMLWYGLVSGLQSHSMVYEYGRGIGWKIAADLVRIEDIWAHPSSDVDFDELRLLSESERPTLLDRSGVENELRVELLPGCDTSLMRDTQASAAPTQQDLFERGRSARDGESALRQLDGAIRDLRSLRWQIERALPPGRPSSDWKKRRK